MKTFRVLILFAFILISVVSISQTAPGRYWIQFTDKNNNPYSLQRPEEFLSERAMQRRMKQSISISFNDLPVSPAYIDSLIASGVPVYNRSKWFNAVTTDIISEELLEKIYNFSFVVKSSTKKSQRFISDRKSSADDDKFSFYSGNTYDYGNSIKHIRIHNGHLLHQQGYTGEGIQIAVLDAGFYGVDVLPAFMDLLNDDRILGTRDFVNRNSNIYQEHIHGMAVLSILGGNIPFNLVGTAPDAGFWLLRSEAVDYEYLIEEDNWVAAAEFADSVGADIINTSLGYSTFDDPAQDHTYEEMDGRSTRISIAAGIAASKGMLVVVSAGNEGNKSWKYITAPSDADSVLSVGATDSLGVIAALSSRGPSSDGRIKPDVCALGLNNYYQRTDGTLGTGGGTSFAAPIISGLAACLWQANPEATNMEIYSAIHESSHKYSNPDTIYGYGIPDFYLANIICANKLDTGSNRLHSLSAFPNPFNTEINVCFLSNYTGMASVILYNVTGKKIKEIIYFINDNYNQIFWDDLPDLPSGIYLIKIQSGESVLTQKIIKWK